MRKFIKLLIPATIFVTLQLKGNLEDYGNIAVFVAHTVDVVCAYLIIFELFHNNESEANT